MPFTGGLALLKKVVQSLEIPHIPDPILVEDGEDGNPAAEPGEQFEHGERTWTNAYAMVVEVVGHGFNLRRVNKNRVRVGDVLLCVAAPPVYR